MKTGEGKTLVSTLPVYLNGLEGRGVHLVTVNEYLASRDAEWMGRVATPGRRRRRVTLAAGECGVKDQVSRTQPARNGGASVGSVAPRPGRIGAP